MAQQPSGDAAPSVVSLRGVTATLGGRPVLRGVDLTLRRGEVVALLGTNGSGKSTTVRATIGQVPLTSGELTLFDTPLHRFRAWARVGYVPQRSTASGGVPATVREVVSAGRLARGGLRRLRRADRQAVHQALELVALGDRASDPVDALSGGQQQRVLIARALAAEPELLLMDEPLAGVDLGSQRVLAKTLRDQVSRGVTVLLVLHELGALKPLIDRSVVLDHGRVSRRAAVPDDQSCHPHGDAALPAPAPGTASLQTGLLH